MLVTLSDDGVLTPDRLALIAGLGMVPQYTYAGYLLFDDVFFSGIAGLLLGAAMYLFIPYVVRVSGGDSARTAPVDTADVRRATVGISLYAAGVVAFLGRFFADGYLVPAALAVVAAAAVYVPTDQLLPGPGGGDATA